jgi:hypothetical protein
MKRYHWTIGIGPRMVSHGDEVEKRVAIDIVMRELLPLATDDTAGLWARVEDVTKPHMWPSPPTIGWEVVYDYRDPRPPVDDPATQGLKQHLREAHNMLETRSGIPVKDEVVYEGALGPDFVLQFHDWAHREERFDAPDHGH